MQCLVIHRLNGRFPQVALVQLEMDLLKLVYDFLNFDWPLIRIKENCQNQHEIEIEIDLEFLIAIVRCLLLLLLLLL